jgi:hypothetical protein
MKSSARSKWAISEAEEHRPAGPQVHSLGNVGVMTHYEVCTCLSEEVRPTLLAPRYATVVPPPVNKRDTKVDAIR